MPTTLLRPRFSRLVMAKRLSASAVISYFSGEEGSEVLFDGSDDELGMEDEEPYDDEPPFEPLEVDFDPELGKVLVHMHIHVIRKYKCLCTLL